MATLPERLSDLILERVAEKWHVLNDDGFDFGIYSEKDESITFFDSRSESKVIVVPVAAIEQITRCKNDELDLLIEKDSKPLSVEYVGFPRDSPETKDMRIIPERHGGTFQDMELLLSAYPKLRRNLWTDSLTGNRYINLSGINGKNKTFPIPDAVVDIQKCLEIDSKNIWGTAISFKKTDTIDMLNRMAFENERNPFLEWIRTTPKSAEPIQEKIAFDNLLLTIGATAPGLDEESEKECLC